MTTQKLRSGHRGIFSLTITTVALILLLSTNARAITFSEWASNQGWSPGQTAPAEVDATSATIDSLAGIDGYNWNATPTTKLNVAYNQITSIEPDAFDGMSNLSLLYLNDNPITSINPNTFSNLNNLKYLALYKTQITSIEANTFNGLGNLDSLDLFANQITRIEAGDFNGLGNVNKLRLDFNQIASIEEGTFSGMSSLSCLVLRNNKITSIKAGTFRGLDQVHVIWLNNNQIANIESGVFSGLSNLEYLYLGDNNGLTCLNLTEADFSSLFRFSVENNTNITSVSLKNTILNEDALHALLTGGQEGYIGIGKLPAVTELDLSGVDFSNINDFSPLDTMDDLTDLWLVGVKNLDAIELDRILNKLDTMQATDTEGILHMTQEDYDAFNATGSGLLAAWDTEVGHHVEIVPEPTGLMLVLLGAAWVVSLRRRKG